MILKGTSGKHNRAVSRPDGTTCAPVCTASASCPPSMLATPKGRARHCHPLHHVGLRFSARGWGGEAHQVSNQLRAHPVKIGSAEFLPTHGRRHVQLDRPAFRSEGTDGCRQMQGEHAVVAPTRMNFFASKMWHSDAGALQSGPNPLSCAIMAGDDQALWLTAG